jgi:hypothetical protein
MALAMWLRGISAVCALVALSLVISLPDQRAVADGVQFDQGLQDGWSFDNEGNTLGFDLLSEQFDLMQRAGAGWVRMHFRLGECYSDWTGPGCRPDGQTALDLYDPVVDLALSYHLKILGLLTHESWRGGYFGEWNDNNVENGGTDGNNRYVTDFANIAAYPVAARFKDRIQAWELWTKPNAWTEHEGTVYGGATFIYPSNYAQLLKKTGAAIKAGNPNATFISGGLLGHDAGVKHQGLEGTYRPDSGGPTNCPSTLPSGGDYLCAVYDQGRTHAGWAPERSPFDGVGQHLYIKQSGVVTPADITAYLDDVRTVYITYGGEPATKQTHITAFGWTSAPFASTKAYVSPSLQAQNLATAYKTLHEKSVSRGGYVARAYWFRTRDAEHPPSSPGYTDYFGLTEPNGDPKPAFSAYQAHAAY